MIFCETGPERADVVRVKPVARAEIGGDLADDLVRHPFSLTRTTVTRLAREPSMRWDA